MMQKPMLCGMATPEEASKLDDEWVVEQKYDGVRALIYDGKLYDRRCVDITERFPEFDSAFWGNKVILDGEIVGREFADVSGRMHLKDKFTRNLLSKKQPCKFVVFDMPSASGTLTQRRAQLKSLPMPKWSKVAEQYPISAIGELWRDILRNCEEGLVVKYRHSLYEWKRRSPNWLKVKAFREVTAEFVKYEEHPKGITIETSDGRRVVVNGKQADEVRETFKNSSKVTVNIQYLPQPNSDAWRFPSFRGLEGNMRG